MGIRAWFTYAESVKEFSDILSALHKPNITINAYSELVYILKVEKEGPFKPNSLVVAWESNSDHTVKKLPYYLRQQTQLLSSIYRKFPNLKGDKKWSEKYGKVYKRKKHEDINALAHQMLENLPEVAIVDGLEKTEETFIEQMYQRNFTDPSILEGIKEKVFISHSHADKNFVRSLANSLSEYGIHAWVDDAEIRPGDSLIWKIATAIKKC